MTPDEIYAESFRIIEEEVGPHPFDADEWPIVRRIIHALGDVDVARSAVFAHDAARAGVRALRRGAAIVTDVAMVEAGINRPAASALGVATRCFIGDADVRALATDRGSTRSACAMEKAMTQVGDAVYVVGNAPTALLALCDAVLAGRIQPLLVIAMPVGFVSVVESKERALALPETPVVALRGRRGGSAAAASAVNAMLELASREPSP
ncbi:MAG: precorrin-8X methylmutase [Isosphaeraceae bacterium]